MARITISDELRDRLLSAGGSVELVDGSGELVARLKFSDIGPPAAPVAEPTLEELQRRFDDTGPRYTTAEVLAYAKMRAGQ